MTTAATEPNEYDVLHAVPWDVYSRITDALGAYHLRHTYDRGTLEMRAVLYGVAWEDYRRFLEALGDISVRHSYWQGTLEMMTPPKRHDRVKSLIARMIGALSLELRMPIQAIGSTTLSVEDEECGVEPDEAYYIANERAVREHEDFDPKRDPPPDLVVEIDVTNSSSKRLSVYAAMKVPEVWRHAKDELVFLGLQGTEYEAIPTSVAFAKLTSTIINDLLKKRGQVDDTSMVIEFQDWVRANMK
jgi:Uma2 family endonuclease